MKNVVIAGKVTLMAGVALLLPYALAWVSLYFGMARMAVAGMMG
jgi:hypothetical protein